MYPLGILFGLGFDTATEVALLFLAAGAAGAGLPFYAILCLPILFAAGMSLLDTIDGAFMNFAYGWAFSKPVRKLYYNMTITGLSVAVALIVGTIELLSVLADRFGLPGGIWDFASNLDLNLVGYLIVGLFVLTWAVALAVWRYGRIEERWTAQLQRTYGSDRTRTRQGGLDARPVRLLFGVLVALLVVVATAGSAAPRPRLTGVRVTGVAPTSVSVVWRQARARVELFVNGRRVAVARGRRFTFSTLTCQTQYRLTLRARDAHGRRSGRTRLFVTTAACAAPDPGDQDKGEAPPPLPDPVVPSPAAAPTAVDTQPPTAPGGLTVGKVTATAIPLKWTAATDDVGVTRYAVYLNGTQILPPGPTATSYTFSGLTWRRATCSACRP